MEMGNDYHEVRKKLEVLKKENEIKPKIGLLPTGHFYYWPQFPALKEMGMKMYRNLLEMLNEDADVVAPELVDTLEKSRKAANL